MCIASKIFNGIAKAIEGFFYKGTPVFVIKTVLKFLPRIRVAELLAGRGKVEFSLLVVLVQVVQIFFLELIPQDSHRDEELSVGFPQLMSLRESTAGNDAMHMHMIFKFLVPGMEHLDDTGCCPEVLPVSRELQKGFGAAFVEQPIQTHLVTIDKRIQLMWKCEHHMIVGGINHFCPAFVYP